MSSSNTLIETSALHLRTLRRMTLAAALLVTLQTAAGMLVNLYVTVPTSHPGAHPGNYLGGSLRSVAWAVGHGPVALAVHATLGLALVAITLWVALAAVRFGPRRVALAAMLGALFSIGAGFNGASFLDFNNAISSLIMALLALCALSSYLMGIYLWPDSRS
jgi:hypothetical protein